jgi:hypothetical protein
MNEKFLKAIALAFKIKNADEWLATLKDGEDWLEEDKVIEIVSKTISDRVAAAKTESRGSGQAEQNRYISKFVSDAGFENPDNLQGKELLTAFKTWQEENAPTPQSDTPPTEMDKETLRKLPVVQSLILEAQQGAGEKFKAVQKQLEEKAAEFEKYKTSVVQGEVKSISREHFEKALRKGNIILQVEGMDIDPNERIDAAFERLWSRKKIGLDANKFPIILKDDGITPDADTFGDPIAFEDISVSIAKPMYGISTQNPNHGGSGIQQTTQNGNANGYTPKMRFDNEKAYNDYMTTEADSANRLEASKSWQHQQSKAAGN